MNIQTVTNKVKWITCGCKCKKGCTGRCGCHRAGHKCGPGCSCVNCTNTEIEVTVSKAHIYTNNIVEQEQERLDEEDDGEEENEYIDEYYDEYDDNEQHIDEYYEQLE